jgi:hypothetical protein
MQHKIKLYIVTLSFLGIYINSFSQESAKTAIASNLTEINTSKENGIYKFILPKGTTISAVEQSAKYYTIYFTVSFDEPKEEVTIKLINNDEKSRHVIVRFLVSTEVNSVSMGGKTFSTEDFYRNYMK